MPNSRSGCEFPPQVRTEAFNRAGGRCQLCGCTHGLQLHHLLPICIAHEYYPDLVSAGLIVSIWNARVVCFTCHKEMDKFAMRPEVYKANARNLEVLAS